MLNKKIKILYITGTRADYGLMRHSLLTLNKLCDLKLVVTGMHLEKIFGYTVNDIKGDNLNIIKNISFPYKTDKTGDLSRNLGHLLMQLSSLFETYEFNYALIEGDRLEALALAIVASCNNIPVIHQGGGDTSGSIDNSIREAITVFSNFHLAGNLRSAEKLKLIGIPKKNIYMFGEPGLDDIINKRYLASKKIIEKYSIDKNKPLILSIHHPDTKNKVNGTQQIAPLLSAIEELNIPSIVIYPNNDPGGSAMIKEINKYKSSSLIKIFSTLPRADFLGLMNICDVMVGNSSSGIIETTLFNVPFINIGSRQKNRLTDANVINCSLNKNEIIKKIKNNLNKKGKFNINYVYGRGSFTKKLINFFKDV